MDGESKTPSFNKNGTS